MRHFVIPLLFLLLVGCSSESDLGEEYTAITEAEFPLDFAPAGLESAIVRYIRVVRHDQGRPILTKWAHWTSPGARLPKAHIRLDQVGRSFVVSLNAKKLLVQAAEDLFAGRPSTLLAERQDTNSLGPIDYVHIRDVEADCVIFFQYWRRERILNTVLGHYCVPLDRGLSQARIWAALSSLELK